MIEKLLYQIRQLSCNMLAFAFSSANEDKSIVVYVHDKTEIAEQNHYGGIALGLIPAPSMR